MNHPDHARDTGAANLRFARALVDELRVAGIAAAVVCPGSRSTPLALAIDGAAGLSYTVHVDERSAAFYALGHAKASGQPVALVCTSGTAGANFLPAVAEAFQGKNLILGPVEDKNHKQIGAQALAYGHTISANTPIDVNLAKQLNILKCASNTEASNCMGFKMGDVLAFQYNTPFFGVIKPIDAV